MILIELENLIEKSHFITGQGMLSSGVNFSNFGTDLRYNRPTPEMLGIWATFYRFQIFALEFL